MNMIRGAAEGRSTVPQTESDLNARFEWWVRRSVAEMVFIMISDYGTVITWFNMLQSCESKQRVSIFKCKALHYWLNCIHDLSRPRLVIVGYPLMAETYWNRVQKKRSLRKERGFLWGSSAVHKIEHSKVQYEWQVHYSVFFLFLLQSLPESIRF